MDRRRWSTALVVLSMVYGAVVAVLAVIDSGALPLVAMIGGVLLGIGWVSLGMLTRGRR